MFYIVFCVKGTLQTLKRGVDEVPYIQLNLANKNDSIYGMFEIF
jgi:hypothetical protein